MNVKRSLRIGPCLATLVIATLLPRQATASDAKEGAPLKRNETPIEQSSDGTVQLLANTATTHGTSVRYEPQPHKNTLGYWTNVNDWVSWTFNVKQSATFAVELTQSCSKSNAGSEYSVVLGETTLRDTVPDTGTFTNFVRRIVGRVTLSKPGSYTLAVKPQTKPHLAVMDLRAVILRPEKGAGN